MQAFFLEILGRCFPRTFRKEVFCNNHSIYIAGGRLNADFRLMRTLLGVPEHGVVKTPFS